MTFHDEIENDELTYRVIGLAIKVHSELGLDLHEHVYRDALCIALEKEGLRVEREKEIPLFFHGNKVGTRKLDLLIEDELVLELKAVQEVTRRHFQQLGANVRHCSVRRGLLLNFGRSTLKIRRFANSKAVADAEVSEMRRSRRFGER